jgi:hypothetical protein
MSGLRKRPFSLGNEFLSGRNEASPEAYSSDTTNGYASEKGGVLLLGQYEVREKRLNAAWKIYGTGPLNGKLP